jgi:molybdopterin adenylyltransferase
MIDAPFAAKVLTVSDGVAAGTRDDRSGRALVERLSAAGYVVGEPTITPDGIEAVRDVITDLATGFAGLIITTGGTGFGPRDLTPEGTRAAIERDAPGLAEAIRAVSNAGGRHFGLLSRGVCGTIGQALICNVAGSTNGAIEGLEAVLPAIPHILELLRGDRVH